MRFEIDAPGSRKNVGGTLHNEFFIALHVNLQQIYMIVRYADVVQASHGNFNAISILGGGMKWDVCNAQSIMTLAAIQQSRLWNTYWQNLKDAA